MQHLHRLLILAIVAQECIASPEALNWRATLKKQGVRWLSLITQAQALSNQATQARSTAFRQQLPDRRAASLEEHQSRIERLTAAHGHRVPLTQLSHDRHFANISIGSPATNYQTLVDTSIPVLWMPSLNCASAGDHTSSQQRTLVDRSVCEDSVQVADINISDLAFLGSGDLYVPFDGFLGLGYGDAGQTGATPLFQTMIDQGLLEEQVLAVYLSTNATDGSELVLGGLDTTHYSGDLVRLPVCRDDGWFVDLDELTLGDHSFDLDTSGALLDAGSSTIVLPTILADVVRKGIGPIDCSRRSSLPDLTFSLSGIQFALSPRDYIAEHDDRCESAIVGLDFPDPYAKIAILGTPFLKKWYTVFDLEDASVHVALAK